VGESKVYFDSCCFIDLAQMALKFPVKTDREKHVHACKNFLNAARAKTPDAFVFTSIVTIVECLYVTDLSKAAQDQKIANLEVQRLFKGMLQSGTSGVMPVATTPMITEDARDLRWVHGITCKPMDALHIASARKLGCTHFITTDSFTASDVNKLAALGLVVSSADKVAFSLLPSKYSQGELAEKPKRNTKLKN
jgi:predicted nucleic acid-binding protein